MHLVVRISCCGQTNVTISKCMPLVCWLPEFNGIARNISLSTSQSGQTSLGLFLRLVNKHFPSGL